MIASLEIETQAKQTQQKTSVSSTIRSFFGDSHVPGCDSMSLMERIDCEAADVLLNSTALLGVNLFIRTLKQMAPTFSQGMKEYGPLRARETNGTGRMIERRVGDRSELRLRLPFWELTGCVFRKFLFIVI
jgi:hypothetical protein